MEILATKLLIKAKLTGRKLSAFEATIIDTGAAFTVIPLELNKDYPKATLVTAGIIETPVKISNKKEVANIKVENLPVVIHKIPASSRKILLEISFIEKRLNKQLTKKMKHLI